MCGWWRRPSIKAVLMSVHMGGLCGLLAAAAVPKVGFCLGPLCVHRYSIGTNSTCACTCTRGISSLSPHMALEPATHHHLPPTTTCHLPSQPTRPTPERHCVSPFHGRLHTALCVVTKIFAVCCIRHCPKRPHRGAAGRASLLAPARCKV